MVRRAGASKTRPGPRMRSSSLTLLALLVSIVAAALLAVAGLGHRLAWWGLPTALHTLPGYAMYGGAAGAALALVALLLRHGVVLSTLALLLGLGAAGLPWYWQRAAAAAPTHDVSTDPTTPPAFSAVLAARTAAAAAPIAAAGGIAADGQRLHPTIEAAALSLPPAQAFDMALGLVRARGWRVVAADAASGHIEATDTSPWFGLVDDMAIRVTASDDGSRVDVRSAARDPMGDSGRNAGRVRAFVTDLLAEAARR